MPPHSQARPPTALPPETPPSPAWRPHWLRDDPRQWRAGTLDREALFARARALAGQPGFAQRAQHFARCWLRTQAAHPELRAVFRNTPRYLLLVASLVLHHRRDPADPTGGVTPGRLLQFFGEAAAPVLRASPGQVKAMLAHARLHGLLREAADARPIDARLRRLEPSPRLEGIFATWTGGFVAALDGVPGLDLPEPGGPALVERAVVAEMFAYRMAALQHDRFVLFEGMPGLRWVLAHDHGYRVMLNLVLAAQPGDGGAVPVPLTHSALAEAAGVSRSHLRNVLADAAVEGWLAAAPRPAGARLALQPAGWQLALEWIARELVWMHGLLRASHARTPAPAGR